MDVLPGSIIPIDIQLWDGDISKFPRAFLFGPGGIPYSPPFVDLASVGNGLYSNRSVLMPQVGPVSASFSIYNDSARTVLDSAHTFSSESYSVQSEGGSGGTVESNIDVLGFIGDDDDVLGFVDTQGDIVGEVDLASDVAGYFDSNDDLLGEIDLSQDVFGHVDNFLVEIENEG